MSENKEVIAKLKIIEEMAVESSVKQLSKVIQQYIADTGKDSIGFKHGNKDGR